MSLFINKTLTTRFIDVYHEHEVLWNRKHPHHRIMAHRKNALKNMIEVLGYPNVTIQHMREVIRKLRTKYSIFARKLVYYNIEPKAHWFKKADSFLRSVTNLYKMPTIMNDEIRSYKKNKTKSGEWNTKRLLPIIFEYKKHPCLWNTLHADYRKRDKYYDALLKIKKSIAGPDVTIFDVEKNIRKIKTMYQKERAKVLFEDEVPTKYWYDVMDEFMQTSTDAQLLNNITNNIKLEDIPKMTSNPVAKEKLLRKLQEGKSPTDVLPKPHAAVVKTYTRSKKPIEQPSQPATMKNFTEKEFKIFGQLIAEQLRNMPLSDALKIQQEMQAMISKTRLSVTTPTDQFSSSNSDDKATLSLLPEEQPSSSTSDAVYFEMGGDDEDIKVKSEYDDDDEYY